MALAKDKEWLKGRDKYATGFCNPTLPPHHQCHEGTKPVSHSGKPMKTCHHWSTCPCECHYNIDQMWKMVGKERTEEIPNPEYVPPVSEFVMPTREMVRIDNAPFRGGGATTPPNTEGTATTPPQAVTAPPTERRGPSGRAGKGTLEAQVFEACVALAIIPTLTPKVVAEYIVTKYKVPTPSSGAIQAVWIRWDKLGIGKELKKPVRWGGFIDPELTWEKLDALKQSNELRARSASTRIDAALRKR